MFNSRSFSDNAPCLRLLAVQRFLWKSSWRTCASVAFLRRSKNFLVEFVDVVYSFLQWGQFSLRFIVDSAWTKLWILNVLWVNGCCCKLKYANCIVAHMLQFCVTVNMEGSVLFYLSRSKLKIFRTFVCSYEHWIEFRFAYSSLDGHLKKSIKSDALCLLYCKHQFDLNISNFIS